MGEFPAPAGPGLRVLVIAAHPDDIEFGAAGTVARWVLAGSSVHYCVVTDGDAGGFDATPRDAMAALRRAEQVAAAETVGVHDVAFLGYPDGRVEPTLELRRDLAAVIREVAPQRVLCPSPERNWARIPASHPDHLAVGEATVRAVYPDARNPFAHPELAAVGLAAHHVDELWLMAGPTPDTPVDVTDTFAAKLAALRCHQSQVAHRDDLEAMIQGWLAAQAERFGLPAGRLAEAFQVVDVR